MIDRFAGLDIYIIPETYKTETIKPKNWIEKVLGWNPCNEWNKVNVSYTECYRMDNKLFITPNILHSLTSECAKVKITDDHFKFNI